MSKSNISNTYYIGHISCATNNAMMKEIEQYLMDFEYNLVHADSISILFNEIKGAINAICSKHKRYKPVELLMASTPFGFVFYAFRSDNEVISIPLGEVLREIIY